MIENSTYQNYEPYSFNRKFSQENAENIILLVCRGSQIWQVIQYYGLTSNAHTQFNKLFIQQFWNVLRPQLRILKSHPSFSWNEIEGEE